MATARLRLLARRATSTAIQQDRFLRIYMSDQLALGVVWRELARRALGAGEGTPDADVLRPVADAIAEDVATFAQMMRRLGFSTRTPKVAVAILAERAGRLKLNGRIVRRSPLSRFQELDVLVMGIEGKVLLWQNLRDGAGLDSRLPDVDFDRLVERARQQRAQLEPLHAHAAREALRAG